MSYAVSFTVSNSLWMTTVGNENPTIRKRHRGRLRAMARQTWRTAKRDGAPFTRRYLMLVTVGGRQESPVLACETLKPLIDAGTDEGLWPDDDPAHRVMTCYLRDPRPLPGGHATINIWVVPLGEYDEPDPAAAAMRAGRAGGARIRVHSRFGLADQQHARIGCGQETQADRDHAPCGQGVGRQGDGRAYGGHLQRRLPRPALSG